MSDGRALLRARQFFGPRARSADRWNEAYRRRWQHDRVVRSTHGVNCTGSCSWKIHVKDGLVTWETQQTDYPSNGADTPDYEPRGCPRGASFSWYVYSPLRPKYPYVRGVLLEMYLEARERLGDPVEAWASIVEDPKRARAYKSQRGKGGFVRASWDDAAELVAAAHVHTIRRYGPDRIAGFSPIPAMSMVSYTAGTRFLSLIGGVCLSFYDWYADLPPASPQIWGDQTDVPESADWWNSSYMILWGSNIPQTRTPDAHFMTEARYKGQKVVVISPDYAGHTKFADQWLPATAGTDGALAMAMGHVTLKEFYVDRDVPYFRDYARRYTDMPMLVSLREREDGSVVADSFLRSSDLGDAGENAEWKTVVYDATRGEAVVPNGSIGFRWGEEGAGRWNLDLEDVDPALTLLEVADELVEVTLPRFEGGPTEGGTTMVRGVPAKRVGGRLVTTVYDLALAQYGVAREGLPGQWPSGYDDGSSPYTPAWQEAITGVDRGRCAVIAREFADNAERTEGRSMIVMGAGTNHWFHSDQTYRSMLALVLFCGCQGVNGGGWAHYVGQEKVRPLTGYTQVAGGLDWSRPTRQMIGTAFWYLHTSSRRLRSGTWPPTSGATRPSAPTSSPRRPATARSATATPPTATRSPRGSAGFPHTRASTATRSISATRRTSATSTQASTSSPSCARAACALPARTPTTRPTSPGCCRCGGPTCSAPPARGTSTFSATSSAFPTPPCARASRPPSNGRTSSSGTTTRRSARSTCSRPSTSG